MDNLLLEAAVLEMRREAVGLPVHRLVPEGRDRLMLLLGDGWGVTRAGARGGGCTWGSRREAHGFT